MATTDRFRRSCLPLLLAAATALLAPAQAATIDAVGYGAVPDDGRDDAAAIQAAINAAGSGDTVALPAGRLAIGATLSLKGGVRLIGAGRNSTLVTWTAGGGDLLHLDGSGTEVAALTLDGAGRAANVGIFAYRSGGHSLHDLTIQDLTGDAALGIRFTGDAPSAANGVTDSTIADCTIRNIGVASEWGGGIRMSWGSSRNRILRNTIDGTGRGGIFANDDSTDLVIADNTVTRSGLTSLRLGIEIWGRCYRSLIEDNRIDHWLSVDSSDGTAVRRNTVADATGWGGFGLEIIAQDIVVADNLVDGGQDIGISMSNLGKNKYVFFASNTIRGVRAYGAQLYAEGDGISQLYFYKNRFLDTQISTMYTGRGFLFNSGGAISTNVVLEANEISGNRDNGLDFLGAANRITAFGNTITGNTRSGVTGNPGTDVDWHDNTVSGNGDDGQPSSRGFADRAPTASFTCPATAVVGQSVTVASTSTDSDGTIAHVLWDLGAGIARTESTPNYAYQKPGSYRITLIAWDDRGRASRAERTIVVTSISGTTSTGTTSGATSSGGTGSAGTGTPDTGGSSHHRGCGLGSGVVAFAVLLLTTRRRAPRIAQ